MTILTSKVKILLHDKFKKNTPDLQVDVFIVCDKFTFTFQKSPYSDCESLYSHIEEFCAIMSPWCEWNPSENEHLLLFFKSSMHLDVVGCIHMSVSVSHWSSPNCSFWLFTEIKLHPGMLAIFLGKSHNKVKPPMINETCSQQWFCCFKDLQKGEWQEQISWINNLA